MTTTPLTSEEFCFEDGDIVLSAMDGDVEHHFRVHRLILSIASPVFKDMLSISQPVGSEYSQVPLRDDSVRDVNALLGALYSSRKAQVLTFDVALGILRLSHKYQIEGFQQSIKWKLLEDWPLNHSDYLARLKFIGSSGHRITEASKLIETAHQCHAGELLPTAYYEVACAWGTEWMGISEELSAEAVLRLWNGRARVEERLRSFAVWTGDPPLIWDSSGSVEEPRSVIQRRRDFRPCIRRSPGPLYESLDEQADRVHFCEAVFTIFRTKIGELEFDGEFALSALQTFDHGDLDENVCSHCQDWFVDIVANKVQELWRNIPAYFNLPEVDSELYSRSHIKTMKTCEFCHKYKTYC